MAGFIEAKIECDGSLLKTGCPDKMSFTAENSSLLDTRDLATSEGWECIRPVSLGPIDLCPACKRHLPSRRTGSQE